MRFGSQLGHYTILTPLGEGGMGVVYRAHDTLLKRDVAIKRLPDAVAADPERLARLQREAQLLAALNHPHVAAIHSLEQVDGVRFLVLELVEGQSLQQQLSRKALHVDRALAIALQVAEAMEAAHDRGIIHRDLKPGNVLVTPEGRVKVLDFGIAKAMGSGEVLDDRASASTLTRSGALMGTPAYISPEQIRGSPADERSDVWSFGCLLYELLIGRPAFARRTVRDTLNAIVEESPDLEALPRVTPEAVRVLLGRCLDKDPTHRPRSAGALRRQLAEAAPSASPALGLRPASRPRLANAMATVAIALVAAGSGWMLHQRSRLQWARTEGLPQLERLAGSSFTYGPSQTMWRAHELARRVAAVIPEDPALKQLWGQVARDVSVETEPPGALVYARPYPAVDAEWALLGTTPITGLRLPIGYHRLRFVREGYETLEDLASPRGTRPIRHTLPVAGSVPAGMVRLPGGELPVFLPGHDHLREELGPFLIDRHEVTNREYARFLEAGGYSDRRYWRQPFVEGARTLSSEEAAARFVDRTGRPGPATWEVGDYPEGQDDFPVSGLSWYEAAAYAAFVDKELPTLFHWSQAANTPSGAEVLPLSNLAGPGPRAVGSSQAMNGGGTFDMAGNVREWVFNATGEGSQRYVMGGAWSDPDHGFVDASAREAFDRSPGNGVRLMRDLRPSDERSVSRRPLARPHRDFFSERPVSDETFQVFLRQFSYDRVDLDARVEAETGEEDWIRQRVSFTAAYGSERVPTLLLLPKRAAPPYQAVIVFPGSSALDRASPDSFLPAIDFLVKSGRAVALPFYKGTYERQDELRSDYPDRTNFWKEHVIMWVKDVSRSIDYLETRDDIDAGKIAYYGFSWGAAQGGVIPAVERRLSAGVLYNGGLSFQQALPEVDPIHYLGRITLPVLMVNGNRDFIFPARTSQRPMFELLGTPETDKRWAVFPGSHSAPRADLIRETLAWLDRYLGPVEGR